ncbi:MAG: malto-oligosyltrehalose synthase [Alphaproteobacteria bacterium]|nr:malto-oligosyltrehalose synthase [Alphaproteobacteria bacterium]MCW5744326.1 malto-oligosyltrehalose synthase [Alphaproteobacteria bacterium]
MTPRATYRLQFHRGFTFADATHIVPYLAALGISHVYASPIAAARAGSTHGYDGIDPTRINPELGGEVAFRAMVAALKERGLGLILDIVPNHMAAGWENAWWVDVLRHGPASRYAGFFDIDWQREDGKVLLPVLGKPLTDVLEAGELVRGDGTLRYHGHRFPLNEHAELGRQHYRLAWWRSAGDRINWRRFFEINDLVCLRQEDEVVFDATHALILRLHREGAIDGVRIDHIDGLTDPAAYCRKLRQRLGPHAYIVVEKILLGGETLPPSWSCDGTSGYDFMDEVSALQHDPAGEAPLTDAWAELSGRPADFAVEEQAARREMLDRSFGGQLEACVDAFHMVAQDDRTSADVTRPALRRVLVELLAHFPVYRIYGAGDADVAVLKRAGADARATIRRHDSWVLEHVLRWLGTGADSDARGRAVARFQQLSAPIAAKAVEDTAFYRYGRLLSRNDVGFDASRFADLPATFHARMARRLWMAPLSMLATATHDHKRGEDVRARLAVLSEIAPEWIAHLRRWLVWSAPLRGERMPVDADLAMLFQTIVGAWPLDLDPADDDGRAAFAERLAAWQQKALREAKLRSDWIDPDEAYEEAARTFVSRLIAGRAIPDLLEGIVAFVERIARAGAINSLAQLVLKLTAPGVPDIYQGTEFWDFSLVDPDNRRPVDFARAAASLRAPGGDWRAGAVKQRMVAALLALRSRMPEVFTRGAYEPIEVQGAQAEQFVAFARRLGSEVVVVAVPRLAYGMVGDLASLAISPEVLGGACLRPSFQPATLVDILDSREVRFDAARVPLTSLFGRRPVAVLFGSVSAQTQD